ncbi:MAG: TolC family protein [Bacteroidales bacterium]|jgi:outer membrane protein|nr:TolC family protein [Bacteroidales bacterium]
MKIFFISILSFIIINTYSQELWTLEKCINHAIENNIQIKTQELSLEINNNQLLQSKLGLLPSISAGASESLTFGRSVDPFTNDFAPENYNSTNFQVSSSITLFNGLSQYNSIKKAEINQKSGLLTLEKLKNDITLNITSAYLNVLFAIDLLNTATEQKSITEEQLERTIKLVDAGSISVKDRYELEAQLANEELDIVNYENQLNISLLLLAQLLEIEDWENFNIASPNLDNIITESSLLSVNEIFNEAFTVMPQVESSELTYQSAIKDLQISRSYLMPTLSLSASYGTGYSSSRTMIDQMAQSQSIMGFVTDINGNILDVYQNTYNYTYKKQSFTSQLKENASAYVTFNLNIPIFNGWQSKTQINNSKIYLEQSKYEIEQTKKDLLKEIQQVHSDAVSAIKKYYATEKSLSATSLSFEYSQKSYDEGVLNITDYNIAKNNLAKAEIELLKAKYELVFKQKILDFYRGREIKL